MPAFLPYGRQCVTEADMAAVRRVLESDFLTTGPEVPAFEADFASVCEAPHAVACNSATAALHLALDALGVSAGDQCIVPSVTFLATANAARYCGADVVFADVDPETGLMTVETFSAALKRASGRVRAVLPVHLGGSLCDMAGISGIARAEGLVIVEDACHALGGADASGAPVGACMQSDAATFSFHPVKTLTSGEGGMVTTRSAALADAMARRRSHGVERNPQAFYRDAGAQEPWWYEQQALGWNYRMPDILAALGRSQLSRLDQIAARRRELVALYGEHLAELAPLVKLPPAQDGAAVCRHLMNVQIDFANAGVSRIEVMARLKAEGVGAQVHYIPVHTQPYYRALYGDLRLPGAEKHYLRTLSLPLYPELTDEDVARVAKALTSALNA
ncbi:MAG: UDP-4-amino-4,6-dideoxy-N-acetyl-beta-L-altrosamine transaminase [Alphaproteobacteria bacterium]|nr:UDP-4-amino-4,6-dideoxy-N-acetyl-beta-L-altrosamine transaminase [Alphaproteobacteria bacterium]